MGLVADMKTPVYDATLIREDFPVLKEVFNGKPLVYLDNGATTQKPLAMINRMTDFMKHEYGTVRRGVYALSAHATKEFEAVRETVARHLNAASPSEIVFVKGTTEAINLVAHSYGRPFIGAGDEILISAIEHHANIVPWQQLAIEKGATVKVIPVLDNGELDMDAYQFLLTDRTKIVAVNHVSNSLGTVNPVKEMIALAHEKGIPVLIDGAQSVPHMKVDVQDLDADFYAFSGHKVYGPTGIGALYGKSELLNKMIPFQTGGDMIESVSFEKTTFQKPPYRFEPGTPAIIEVIGLGTALDYINELGLDNISRHEHELLTYATAQLLHIDGLRIIGTAANKAGVISFVFDDIHPHDVGTLLDQQGIAVRAGHHCTQPVMDRFCIPATTRASFGVYNTFEDVDQLIAGLNHVIQVFR